MFIQWWLWWSSSKIRLAGATAGNTLTWNWLNVAKKNAMILCIGKTGNEINTTHYMWCDVRKTVWSRTCDILSFLFEELIRKGTLCWKPHLNRTSGSKVMSNWRILKTMENKGNTFLLCLYLTINAPDFRIIPLDCNTYSEIVPQSTDTFNSKNNLT